MTLEEIANISLERPDAKPPAFGRTLLVIPVEGHGIHDVLQSIRDIWSVVASWGRWCDEEMGEWPSPTICIAMLPRSFTDRLKMQADYEIDNWFDDLHDRDWIIWSIAPTENGIKIDLATDSMPISTWPLEFVANNAGGHVSFRGDWISSRDARQLLGGFPSSE